MKDIDKKRFLISGFYGFKNAGDEAVLEGIINSISAQGARHITVLSADCNYTNQNHPKAKAVPRYSKAAIKALATCDIFISGGGILLQNITSNKSLYYYLIMLRMAQILGKKTAIYAQGIGPISGKENLKATKHIINKTNYISTRDQASKELLVSMGINENKIHLTLDPAFVSEKDLTEADRVIKDYNLANKNFIVIAIRPFKDNKWTSSLSSVLNGVKRLLDIEIVAIPFLSQEDTDISLMLENIITIKEELNWHTIKGIISKSQMVIGQRLHSLIFAASENIPFVTLSYDPKTEAFASIFESNKIFQIDKLPQKELTDFIIDTYNNRKEISNNYIKISNKNITTIYETAKNIVNL